MNFLADEVSLPGEARDHLERYWHLARRFFEEGDLALAAFFAITLIEEVGKIVILGNKDLSGRLDERGFFNHQRKYAYAVGMTLEVNARVTRIYGRLESRFATWFREGTLFDIRNAALYLELRNGSLVVPNRAISRSDALLLVCIAGEVYGEIQGGYTGIGPEEWERIISEVDEFRERHLSDLGSA